MFAIIVYKSLSFDKFHWIPCLLFAPVLFVLNLSSCTVSLRLLYFIYWIVLQSLKLVCFMVANSWKRKYADSWLLLTRWQCLFNRETSCLTDVWKYFKFWLNSSNPPLSSWIYFPRKCLLTLKLGNLLKENWTLKLTFHRLNI